jgi:hypothetical protein
MIGLLVKDLYVLKKQLKLALIILVFYAVLSYTGEEASMFVYMSVMFGFFLPLTTIAYDDRCEWNKLALTMPIRTSWLVTSKYLLGVLGVSIGSIGFLLLSVAIKSTLTIDNLKVALTAISAGALIISIYLPICFQFGVEKSRYIIIAIFMVPSVLVMILVKGNYIKEPTMDQIKPFIDWMPLLTLILLSISIVISIAIMNRKEY